MIRFVDIAPGAKPKAAAAPVAAVEPVKEASGGKTKPAKRTKRQTASTAGMDKA